MAHCQFLFPFQRKRETRFAQFQQNFTQTRFKTFHIFRHFVTQEVARKFCGRKVSPVNHCDYAAPIRSPRSWANGFFKNRGSSCKRSLNLSTQLSRGLFAENRLGALLSNRNACYAGYIFFKVCLSFCENARISF